FDPGAVVTLRLDVHRPLTAEAVEVIHEQSAHEGLKCFVDIVDRDALLKHLNLIDVYELLRDARQQGRAQSRNLPTLAGRRHKGVQVVCEKGNVVASAIFQNEGEPSGCADTGNRGRRKIECDAFRQRAQLAIQALLDLLKLLLRTLTITPFLQRYEEETVVTGADE